MKKIVMIAAVAALSMASCKKVYTCECTANTGVSTVDTYSYETGKVKKADAEKSCDAMNSTYSLYKDGKCSLK